MRITPTRRASEKHYRKLEKVAPKTGIVRVLRITAKQYESIYLLSGEIDYQEKKSARTAISCYNWDMKKSSCVRANSKFSIERHLWHKM